jgi:3-oxoacyl-[acyl-carrier protein] reductase/pteridine reductase
MSSLAGKSVFITGGARRIGRALSLAFARAGCDVIFTFRNSVEEAASLTQEIAEMGREAEAIRCDVRDPLSVREAIAEGAEWAGQLDILVNNAGVYYTTPFEDITVQQWDEVFETNARAPFLLAQAAAPQLRANHGRIINIGSLGGIRAWASHAHYCASKAALHHLTQAMAKALAPEIVVNAVAPGMIFFPDTEGHESYKHFAEKTPMRRNGTADDVAAATLFFATCPPFITGQVLAVDGGLGL